MVMVRVAMAEGVRSGTGAEFVQYELEGGEMVMPGGGVEGGRRVGDMKVAEARVGGGGA